MQGSSRNENGAAQAATQEDIGQAITAASAVFARYRADPLDCAAAHRKRAGNGALSKPELLRCLIWDEASDSAWHAARRAAGPAT